MNPKFWLMLFGLLVALLLVWAFSFLTLVGHLLFWVPAIGVPVAVSTLWFRRGRHGRRLILHALDEWGFLLISSAMLAMLTTLLILFASWDGLVVPVLDWGLSGTPWAYVYVINLAVWSGVVLMAACFHSGFRDDFGRYLHNWAAQGGCWKIGSTDNTPANRLIWLCVIVAYIAFLYGLPTPSVDAEVEVIKAQVAMQPYLESVNQAVGLTVFEPIVNQTTVAEERFIKSWFWIKVLAYLLPLALIGFIASRRDGVSEFFGNWSNSIAEKQGKRVATVTSPEQQSESQAVASTEAQPKVVVVGGGAEGGASSSYSDKLGREIIAEGAVRVGEVTLQRGLEWLSRLLRRATR